LETDLKEFKNVHKQYTDQLIRVKVTFVLNFLELITKTSKVSDMANSDLEKYAKALISEFEQKIYRR